MVEAMGLKITASHSPLMASPPNQISYKSTNQVKCYGRQTDSQADDLISLLFIFHLFFGSFLVT
jgi:hypothetical protein